MKKKGWNRKTAVIIIISIMLMAFTGCQRPSESVNAGLEEDIMEAGSYQSITAEEAKKMMDEEDVVIVDVRTQEEFDEGHIENSILVTNETIGDTLPEALPDQSAIILVYCRSGRRSKEASKKLVELGYKNVYEFGGIIDWPYGSVKE